MQQNTGGLPVNPTDLNNSPEEQKILKPEVLIIGIGAIATLTIAYLLKRTGLLKRTRSFPYDPPPIIIKSGSFIIETNQVLSPDQPNKPSYKRGFNGIKGIRVVTYNEQIKDTDDDYFYEEENNRWRRGDNVKVFIELQSCQSENNGVCVSWNSPQVVEILNNINDLEIKVPIRLSKSKKNKKDKRKFKYEDEHNEFIRFTRVTIINTSQGNFVIKNYPFREYQEFFIAFYNTL